MPTGSRHALRRSEASVARPRRAKPSRSGSDRIVRWILWGIAVGGIVWTLWYFAGLFLYLGIGIVFAYILKPLVDQLQGIGVGRIPAILVTAVVVVGSIATLVTYLAPFLVAQLSDLSQQFSLETLEQLTVRIEAWIGRIFPVPDGALMQSLTRFAETLVQEDRITATMGSIVALFTDLFYAILIVPFVTFFFLKDGTKIRHALFRLVPNAYFEITLSIVDKVETILGRYFRGLVLQCASVAAVASVLLSVVGLRYAIAVGVFTGLANTIPYFGPALGFVAGTFVAIAQTGDFSLVPYILVAMALTQVSDNVFFQPLIFSRVARTHPLVILFVVLIGAQMAGILGMLVAIPLATMVRVAVQQVIWSFRNYRVLQAER
jgi:predicted PurR-regulated permease PerM